MAILDLGFKYAHRFVCRRRERLARAQTKSCAMTRANDFIALDFAAGQFGPIVSTDILNRKVSLAASNNRDHAPAGSNGFRLTIR